MAAKLFSKRRREALLSSVWGGVWGVVVGGVIITVASQLAVRHDLVLPQPQAGDVGTPAGTEFDQARPETDPEVPSEETVPGADVAAVTPAEPQPAISPVLDTQSAAAPSAGGDGPTALGGAAVPEGAEVTLSGRESLRPETGAAPEATAPLPPNPEQPVAVARDVPAPSAPAPVNEAVSVRPQTAAPAAPQVEAVADAAPDAAPAPVERSTPEVAASAPTQPTGGAETAPTPDEAPAEAPVVAETDPSEPEAPDAEPAPEAPLTAAEASPEAVAPSELEANTAEVAPEQQTTVQQPAPAEAPAPRRIITESAVGSTQTEDAPVPPPSVGQPAARRVGVGTLASDTEEEVDPDLTRTPENTALRANRNAFERDPERSMLSFVLMHQGDRLPDADALENLPGEVSFAVSGAGLRVAEIAQAYRAAGREVVLIPSFPPGAKAQDVEVSLAANLSAVDMAVAVMDPGSSGFQRDREAVGQVVSALAESGHGLITAASGLNTAQQTAERFEVPAATIFNDLGSPGSADAVGRALDRVAFRARQEEGIIIVGRADAITYEGLAEWVTGRSAEGLQLAPVSAVVDPEEDEEDSAPLGEVSPPPGRVFPQIQSAPSGN